MDPISITLTILGWLAAPFMTQLTNYVSKNSVFSRNQKISTKLNLLTGDLYFIGNMAKKVQITDVHTFREWLLRFKDTVYEAEDVISSDKLNEKKINLILDKFQLLAKEIKTLLKNLTKREEIPTWRKTTYLMSMSRSIKGRTSEIDRLIDWLLNDQSTNTSKNFSLLSIIGAGGIGKTVLSQFIFNDREVQDKFEVTAWVNLCNASTPDIKFKHDSISFCERIFSFFQTNYRTDSPETRDEFQNIFESRMKGKRFFMVLDDMWEHSDWDNFYCPLFNCGKEGSKIIVTTQLEEIANIIDSDLPIKLDALDPDEYWELFKDCTFGRNNPPSYRSVLEDVGREISLRFGCSPLAAVEVGRVLKCSLNQERWNLISRNKFCIEHRKDGDIISILGFCYEQLPEHLKQCYLSCALFPRNYPFEKHELNLIWIGLGSLNSKSSPTNYIDNFSNRSFLVNATSPNNRYVFHHVLHELAEYISDGEFLRLEQRIEHTEIPMHTRHVYITAKNFVEASEALRKRTKLRTLVIVGTPHQRETFMESLEKVTKKLEFLRFLVLPVPPKNVSDMVGKLTYLRFLKFPKNQQKLPKLSNSILGKYKLKLWNDSTYLLVNNDIDKLIKLYCSSATIVDIH